jgi:hypothetical protein
MNRDELIDVAVGVNENYRIDDRDRDLEVGFLYGTAELITALTLGEDESYSEVRESIAQQIDQRAAKASYAVLD